MKSAVIRRHIRHRWIQD